ncbi:hypothetical protein NDN08_004554 [Rhodosorus marinus]|uniref:Adenine DNA glycosylase n=1 Tax=Rhodosorus marinus TaxID=101924 RepID=A0AAV8US66_9RHOD|nr:hypothetical protein NDN08_004554 [Rhodosorus marinus]
MLGQKNAIPTSEPCDSRLSFGMLLFIAGATASKVKSLVPGHRRGKIRTAACTSKSDEPGFLEDEEANEALRKKLLSWYEREHRDLPWRATPFSGKVDVDEGAAGSPYAVWVSEIMLQQTQVATVVPYFERWMKEFPTLVSLSRAEEDRINELWAGLGYYRRARMLHQGAKLVVEKHGGTIPQDTVDLLKIPGIGPYTAGAIASIAFRKAEPLVDGNVARVFSRLLSIDEEPSNKVFWVAARRALDGNNPGDFNQALMELGSTVCTPKVPSCAQCPLRLECKSRNAALERGLDIEDYVTKFPRKPKKTKQQEQAVAVCVVENDGHLLMLKRPKTGLLPGLWEFPSVEVDCDDDKNDANRIRRKLRTLGLALPKTRTLQCVGSVGHIFTHIRQTLRIYKLEGAPTNEIDSRIEHRWTREDEVEGTAISAQMKKVFEKSKSLSKPDDGLMDKFVTKRKRKRD